MKVDITPLTTIDKRSNGLRKFDLHDVPLPPEFTLQFHSLILIPPLGVAGNHRHPRRELFISLSDDLEMHWIDERGFKQINKMKNGDHFYIFDVQSLVPHVIFNLSKTSDAIVLEFSNCQQFNVDPYMVSEIGEFKE